MSAPVDKPEYWRERIAGCKGELHRTMFRGTIDQMSAKEYHDRILLEKEIKEYDSILDCGCGYGRLLYLLPDGWKGSYIGVDVSPDMVNLANAFHPSRTFLVADLRDLSILAYRRENPFDLAVVSWVRSMVITHLGGAEWDKMEAQIRPLAKRVLYLQEPDS